MEIRPYSAALGAEITGVDLSRPLSDRVWTAILDAFRRHMVIFFRDQRIPPEAQVVFARRFGQLEPYPFVNGIAGFPELIEIVKLPDEVRNFGEGWHVDMSYREQPPLGAVLYGTEIPAVGGDTVFANMALAYATLSKGMKSILKSMRGIHDSQGPEYHADSYKGMSVAKKQEAVRQASTHPMIRRHPETGVESLFISPDYCRTIEDFDEEEGRLLLALLERHATRHEFICRFRWEPNSVAVWDNRCTMHMALNDDIAARLGGAGFKRVMRRATIRC